MNRLLSLIFVLGLACCLFNGCVGSATSDPQTAHSADEHDHAEEHEHPETFTAAVAELESLVTQVKDAFAAKDMATADGPVHEIGHLLEELPALLEKAGLHVEHKAAVDEAIQTLFARFAEVDELLHNGAGKAYEEVASEVEAAIAALKKIAELKPE